MSGKSTYQKKFNYLLIALIVIPTFAAIVVFAVNGIIRIYGDYNRKADFVMEKFEKCLNEYESLVYQRARFINYNQDINAALINKNNVRINGETIKKNNSLNEILKNAFFDPNFSMEYEVFTDNENAVPFNIIKKVKDDAFYSSVKEDYLGTWKIEPKDKIYYFNFYKKFILLDENNYMIKIGIPLENIIKKSFEEENLSDVYMKIETSAADNRYINVGFSDGKIRLEKDIDDIKMFSKDYSLELTKFKVHILQPKSNMIKDIAFWICKFMFIMIMAMFVVIFIIRCITKWFIDDIKQIVKSIGQDDINDIENIFIKNEEFDIIREYLVRLRDTLQKENKEKIDFETQMLAQRITPHFIYNNLSAIKSFCDNEEARKAIDMFIKYCRRIFDNKDRFTTLKTECENAAEYLKLLQFCYDINFDVNICINEACSDMFIPANILQPILENAFVHGINCLADESGKIDISAEYSDELLRLRVVDNAGMFNSEKYASRSRSALGILSDQIKLYYKNNEKCKISICGDQTKTTVEVVVTGGRG